VQEAGLAQRLAAAGLNYLGMADVSAPLVPPRLAAFADSAAAGGREWAVSVENGAEDFRERVNHEWYLLCAGRGLFDREDPRFFVAAATTMTTSGQDGDTQQVSWWAEVALRSEWDLAGAGAEAQVTGRGLGHPDFVMLSLDGTVIVRGSQGQKWTDIVCLQHAEQVSSFREMGVSMTRNEAIPSRTREALTRWLDHTA
jgi:hypothetical protein